MCIIMSGKQSHGWYKCGAKVLLFIHDIAAAVIDRSFKWKNNNIDVIDVRLIM